MRRWMAAPLVFAAAAALAVTGDPRPPWPRQNKPPVEETFDDRRRGAAQRAVPQEPAKTRPAATRW